MASDVGSWDRVSVEARDPISSIAGCAAAAIFAASVSISVAIAQATKASIATATVSVVGVLVHSARVVSCFAAQARFRVRMSAHVEEYSMPWAEYVITLMYILPLCDSAYYL